MQSMITKSTIETPIQINREEYKYSGYVKSSDLLYFIALSIFLIYTTLNLTLYLIVISQFWKPVYMLCVALLLIYEIFDNGISLRQICYLLIVFGLVVGVVSIAEGATMNSVAMLMLFMFCGRKISFRDIAKLSLMVTAILLLFIIVSSQIGVIQNYVLESGGRRREFLGFRYALYAPALFSNIAMLWIYIRRRNYSLVEAGLLGLIDYYFYMKTDSRLSFLLTMGFIIVSLFLKRYEKEIHNNTLVCWGTISSFVIGAVVSFRFTIKYNPYYQFQSGINAILGNRLYLGQESLRMIGVNLFGIKGIPWTGNGLDMYGVQSTEPYLYVDNYYIHLAQRFGLLVMIMAVLLMTIAAYQAHKNIDVYLLLIYLFISIHLIVDNLPMFLCFNTFWLAVGRAVLTNESEERTLNELKIQSVTRKY